MRRSRFSVLCGGLLLALVLSVGLVAPASAAYEDVPVGPTGWVPEGPVQAVAVSGRRVFVGGCISLDDCGTRTHPRSGFVAALDASTGELLWTVNAAPGEVHALAVSSDGSHVIVGGSFNTIGGATHRGLALLRAADGTVEPDWRASARAMVRDIVVVGDVAYFGGEFARHNDLDQVGLGAVSVSTGAPVADFDASVADNDETTSDEAVYSLATDGARLFVGGAFTRVDGQPRNNAASVTLATHALDAWAPALACDDCNRVWDLLVDGGTAFMANRNAGAVTAYDKTTGVRRWQVTANGDAQALAMAGGMLYAGGHFVEIDKPRQPRQLLAALDPTTGAIDPDFQPDFAKSFPGIWALAATRDRLYVGGHFTAAGPRPPQRYPFFAMFAPTTPPPAVQCADGLDNDGDGKTDYPADPGCTGSTDTTESPDPPVNTAPVAQAAATPASAVTGEEITLSAAGSSDAETPANLSYAWDFGNGGTTADATGKTVKHAYQQAASYTATVTVTDPAGASDTATVGVVVSPAPVVDTIAPEARVRFTPRPALTRTEITLDGGRSSDDTTHADDLSYAWRFKRGTHTGEQVSVTFRKPGLHRVRLTVTDEAGNRDTLIRQLRVRSFVHCQARRVDLTGGWGVRNHDRAIGGRYCDSSGRQRGTDAVSFTFQGPEVSVIHGVARHGGRARVFIDGERRRALSFWDAQRELTFQQKRTYRQLGEGQHVIRIEMVRRTGFLEGFRYGG